MKEEQRVLELTPTIARQLIGNNYKNKDVCVKLADDLKIHALGIIPDRLISERRPSESEEIKSYRRKIYVPKTKNPISKVISSLEKIRRSQDWNIQYDADSVSNRIASNETLENYCEYNYPVYTSITNWAFSELLRQYLIDANGIIAVVIDKLPQNGSEYVRPVAKFFGSEQIVDYKEGEFAILKSKDTSEYMTGKGRGRHIVTDGDIYYILTPNEILKYEQMSADTLTMTDIYSHKIGRLPAFKAGGVFHERRNNDTIYESRIAGMVPDLDEAAREYSDLQAEIVQHIHSEKYVYTNAECPTCKGSGRVIENGEQHECKRCGGSGSVLNVSPYGVHIIDSARAGEQQLPTPPVGYVQKSADIAKLQDERVRQHIYDALAAVNMEFLAETPIAQSGIAKQVDRDELNNFVNSVAEDIVRILDNVYWFVNEYRYKIVEPNDERREAMLPKINVPTKYDLLNTSVLMQELDAARKAEVNPIILRELEIDYAKKQFCTNTEIAKMVETSFDLDPLFGVSDDAKMTMLSNGGITEAEYIISCNVNAFVRRAVYEDRQFYAKTYEQKMQVLRGYAEEVKMENEPKTAVMGDLGGLDKQ